MFSLFSNILNTVTCVNNHFKFKFHNLINIVFKHISVLAVSNKRESMWQKLFLNCLNENRKESCYHESRSRSKVMVTCDNGIIGSCSLSSSTCSKITGTIANDSGYWQEEANIN